jgi:hypothetical protein
MSLRERTRPRLGIIEPCLPSPAKAPPSGPGWLHEIKHDGFRIMARRDVAGVRLITRAGATRLIRTLRKTYGPGFASGCADDAKLSDVLHKLDEQSL